MKIETKYLGELQVEEENIVHFPTGLPGFIEETEFVLLDLPGNPAFQVMQSATTVDIAFVITNPYHFYPEYTFELDDNTAQGMQIESENDVAVFSIVTLKSPFEQSTLNLKAPVIINTKKNLGKQYILNVDDYPSKASIITSATTSVKGE